jgi:hypothetical protein
MKRLCSNRVDVLSKHIGQFFIGHEPAALNKHVAFAQEDLTVSAYGRHFMVRVSAAQFPHSWRACPGSDGLIQRYGSFAGSKNSVGGGRSQREPVSAAGIVMVTAGAFPYSNARSRAIEEPDWRECCSIRQIATHQYVSACLSIFMILFVRENSRGWLTPPFQSIKRGSFPCPGDRLRQRLGQIENDSVSARETRKIAFEVVPFQTRGRPMLSPKVRESEALPVLILSKSLARSSVWWCRERERSWLDAAG